MFSKGYRFASFVAPGKLEDPLEENPIEDQTKSGPKPLNAWYFSVLKPSDNDKDQIVPEWYEWLVDQGDQDSIEKCDIVFAKYHPNAIIKNDNPLLEIYHDAKNDIMTVHAFRWTAISKSWSGIFVELGSQRRRNPFYTWDVDTLAVWDYTGLKDVKRYRRADVGNFHFTSPGSQII
jgi:hypothetical protein